MAITGKIMAADVSSDFKILVNRLYNLQQAVTGFMLILVQANQKFKSREQVAQILSLQAKGLAWVQRAASGLGPAFLYNTS